jgi:hypothetical protein
MLLNEIEQVQLGVRLDKGLIDRLKIISGFYGCTVADVLEMIIGKSLKREHFFKTNEELSKLNDYLLINDLEKNIKDIDTIVVAASNPTFKSMYMNNFWGEVPIASYMKDKIQYLATYQLRPINAICYISRVIDIVPGTKNVFKYKLVLGDPMPIKPVPISNKTQAARHPRYTSAALLIKATRWEDVFLKK